MDTNELTTQLTALLNQYTADQTARIQSLEDQLATAQAQIDTLRTVPAGRFPVYDPALRSRLADLGQAAPDSAVRDSCILFENRLRTILGDAGKKGTGNDLVDLAFGLKSGLIQVSEDRGEQNGIAMLYRGAFLYIRNPAMHDLIDYDETTAAIHITLIDSLLRLLDQLTQPPPTENSVPKTNWTLPRLRAAYAQYTNRPLAVRLTALLDWAASTETFARSNRAKYATFGIKGPTGQRNLTLRSDGAIYFFLRPDCYIDETQREQTVTLYKSLGLLDPYTALSDINDGRFSLRYLHDLSDQEWTTFKDFITTTFKPTIP